MASNDAFANAVVTGTLAATGDSSATPFYPVPGRAFNVSLSGTWAGTALLKRKLPGEAAFSTFTVAGAAGGSWTANLNEAATIIPVEAGEQYAIYWTRVSGSLVYRLGQ
jgi:hypothetical protein